ncbi:MAG: hypothetical protein KDA63_08535 [Planctomycetales bacterium]|nr:hypothetical protein [Planctomycetales bacterium]
MGDRSKRRVAQFGVRELLLAMVVMSAAFGLLLSVQNWVTVLISVVVPILAAAGFTAAVVYGRGDLRAFCMGALFPVALVTSITGYLFLECIMGRAQTLGYCLTYANGRAISSRAVMLFGIVLTPIAGALSVGVRRRLSSDE